MDFESQQHFVLVGQVADDAPERGRQLFDQRGRRENPVRFRGFRMFQDVDDLEGVLTLELVLADALEVGDCRLRARTAAADVQLQDVVIQVALGFTSRKLSCPSNHGNARASGLIRRSLARDSTAASEHRLP